MKFFLTEVTLLKLEQFKLSTNRVNLIGAGLAVLLFGSANGYLAGLLIVAGVGLAILVQQLIFSAVLVVTGSRVTGIRLKFLQSYPVGLIHSEEQLFLGAGAGVLGLFVMAGLFEAAYRLTAGTANSTSEVGAALIILRSLVLGLACIFALPSATSATGWLISALVVKLTRSRRLAVNILILLTFLSAFLFGWVLITYWYPSFMDYSRHFSNNSSSNILVVFYFSAAMVMPMFIPVAIAFSGYQTEKTVLRRLRLISVDQLKLGQSEKALKTIGMALELEPTDFNSYLVIGTIYFDLKNYPAALQALGTASRLDQKMAMPYYYSGLCYLQMREYRVAIEYLSWASSLAPDNSGIYLARSWAYIKLEMYQLAAMDLEQAFEKASSKQEELQVLTNKSYFYYRRKDYPNSITECDRLLSSGSRPEDNVYITNALYNRSLCYLRLSRLNEARQDLISCRELTGQIGLADWILFWLELDERTGPSRKAIEQVAEIVKLTGEEYDLRLAQTVIEWLKTGPAAIEQVNPFINRLEELTGEEPEEADAYYWLSQLYQQVGRTEQVVSTRAKAVALGLAPALNKKLVWPNLTLQG
ncbi:MAG TPA: tetratricopeptide repeat protein [Chloroflexia bacterium]|nr:tetratricopeptide repeat protein [Chloroflexia bacterium]